MRLWTRRQTLLAAFLAIGLQAASCSRPQGEPLPVLPIGGDFALTDHHNTRFELASLRGKVVLIFFGYSFCPDACPTTLSKLSAVGRKLGADRAAMKTLYVSVDPQRDTPEVLKADLANFDLDALGLTGSKTEIDAVAGQYGAAYQIVQTPESAAEYTVSHTTSVYALDKKGRVRLRFRYEATVDEIVEGIKAILADRT